MKKIKLATLSAAPNRASADRTRSGGDGVGVLLRHAWAVLLCAMLLDVITGISTKLLSTSSFAMFLLGALPLLVADLPVPGIAWIIARVAFRKLPGAQSARVAALWATGGYIFDAGYRLFAQLSPISN